MNVAGQSVRDDQVAILARLLGDDPLAKRLLTAVEHGVTIFALSASDRERILSVALDGQLGGLKQRLVDQRKRQRDTQDRRERVDAQRLRDDLRRDARAARPSTVS